MDSTNGELLTIENENEVNLLESSNDSKSMNDSMMNKQLKKRFNLRKRKTINSESSSSNDPGLSSEKNKKIRLNNGDNNVKCTNGQTDNDVDDDDDTIIVNNNSNNNNNNNNNNDEKKCSKIIIYKCNYYLAVRNEHQSFFLCQARQNIYRNGRKIKIKWYTNDDNQKIYRPDFDDYIDFECILTDLRIKKERDGGVSLPESEKNRALNILQRALDVEKGVDLPPDPRNVLSDGLDISIIGKVNEEDVLSKINCNKKSANDNKNDDDDDDKNKTTTTSSSVINNVNNDLSSIKLNDHSVNDQSINELKNLKKTTTTTKQPFLSSFVSSKSLIQHVKHRDYEKIHSIKNSISNDLIYSISIPSSITIRRNVIHQAILNKDLQSLRLLYEIENNLNNNDNNLLIDSIELDHCELMMDKMDYSKRKQFPLNKSYIEFALKNGIGFDFLDKLLNTTTFVEKNFKYDINLLILTLKCGQYEQAQKMIDKMIQLKHSVNHDHHVYKNIRKLLHNNEISSSSGDHIIDHHGLYPIHIAAINPDPFVFQSIIQISHSEQIYSKDCQNWMPIHYASVCQTFFNLKYLLNLGVSARITDHKGNTSLHLATKFNQIENVKLIIQYELPSSCSSSSIFNQYNHKGFTAFHIACQKGYIELIKIYLDNRIDIDFATSNHSGELTPLMIATKYGHINIVKLLIDHGATINHFDRKNRNALTHAVINGHTNLVEYFLEIGGANPSYKDVFGNNLFHYALAYGWYDCFELLLKTNINLKDTNIFGLTPIYAAVMKGHLGFIRFILKKNILNINVPVNDTGINLTMLACSIISNINFKTIIQLLRLFIQKYKCDLSKTDYEKNNALHYLIKCEAKCRKNTNSTVINEWIQRAMNILMDKGCDIIIYQKNMAGISPLEFSLSNQCFDSFSYIIGHHQQNNPLFYETLNENEHLWSMIINSVLKPFNDNQTFGTFIIDKCKKDENFNNLLKAISMKTNATGDLPIEFFIKISKHLIKSSSNTAVAENVVENFFNFLMKFYDTDFIKDLLLLHLAANFAPKCIIQQLIKILTDDIRNESNQTPLTVALMNDNIDAIEVFLTNEQIKIDSDYKIKNMSCFHYYLQHCSSLNHCRLFLKKFEKNQCKIQDKYGNTCLHLICKNIERNNFIDTVELFIANGVDVDAKNFKGQNALHVAFECNKFTKKFEKLLNILINTNKINLYAKDSNGLNAFNYLFINQNDDPVDLFMKIHNQVKFIDIIDDKQMNLLHYAAKTGSTKCLTYLLQFIDPNLVDNDNFTPLALAILNGYQESTSILLKSKKNRILDNLEFISRRKNVKINLLCHLLNNYWKDALFIIEERAIQQNELNELIEISIKSQCLSYATNLIQTNNVDDNEKKIYLQLFAKYTTMKCSTISMKIQDKFLKIINNDNILSTIYVDLFQSAFYNWNYYLCNKLIETFTLNEILKKLREKNFLELLLPLCFKRLIFERSDLPDEMIKLIELIFQNNKNCHQDIINLLSNYPIDENSTMINRYRTFNEHDDFNHHNRHHRNHSTNIKYSPLIIAIIMKCYKTFEWLLQLQISSSNKFIVDVNFMDSIQRTPLMHAVILNDLKIIQLLLNRKLNILQKDLNQYNVFHYLISPFKYGNYLKSIKIFEKLCNLIEIKNNDELIDELYRFAIDKNAQKLIDWMKITFKQLQSSNQNLSSTNHNQSEISNSSVSFNYHQLSPSTIISPSSTSISNDYRIRRIIKDSKLKIPYDVIFTKLDYQQNGGYGGGGYVYNYFKIQLLSYGRKYNCLSIRWGRVGTKGMVKKIYYNSRDESIEQFKLIFAKKSGENWNKFNNDDEYIHEDKIQIENNTFNDCDNLNLNEIFDKINHLQQNPDDEIIEKYGRIFQMEIDNETINHPCNNNLIKYLNGSKSIENCLFILNRLSKLIAFNRIKNDGGEDVKLLNDMIDLSEQFYSQIKIYDGYKQLDQLKPILRMDDLNEMINVVLKLKTIVLSIESFNSSSKFSRYKFNKLTDSYELDMINSYLSNIDNDCCKLFKINNDDNSSTATSATKSTTKYLLWCRMKSFEFFNFLFNGFDYQTLSLLGINNLPIILNGVCLTNKIITNNDDDHQDDQDDFYLLCEASINNSIEINDDITKLTFDNYETFLRNKDCLILSHSNNNDDHYIQWKGYIVPIHNSDNNDPKRFLYLTPKQLIPRYLLLLLKK